MRSVPWIPRGEPLCRRLIKEVVLDEESDEIKGVGYLSHFEIYLQAMDQCGADTTRVNDFIEGTSNNQRDRFDRKCGRQRRTVFKSLIAVWAR
jgi:hypothetical protein